MKFFKETTDWQTPTKNHIYLLSNDKSKMYAYVRAGSDSVFKFAKPIRFDTRGRKFLQVKNNWNFKLEEDTGNPTWQVQGSKGDIYTIEQTDNGFSCSCSGFRFRGNCKHVKEFEAKNG